MSRMRKETIACPACGTESDFVVWQSLNGDLNPEAKQQLLDGTLFRFECKNCGHTSNVDYGVLYHDMMHQAMVYYVDEASVEKAIEAMVDVGDRMGVEMPGYRKRVVTDRNALREKAIIFEHGLDDRVVEIIKLIYYDNASEQFPEANISAVYFSVADDKYTLDFIGDTQLCAEVPGSVYDDIQTAVAERLKEAGDKEAIINFDWASNFLKE